MKRNEAISTARDVLERSVADALQAAYAEGHEKGVAQGRSEERLERSKTSGPTEGNLAALVEDTIRQARVGDAGEPALACILVATTWFGETFPLELWTVDGWWTEVRCPSSESLVTHLIPHATDGGARRLSRSGIIEYLCTAMNNWGHKYVRTWEVKDG